MGMNCYSYIGPVLYLKQDIEVPVEKTVCPNGHKVSEKDKFCSKCGSATEIETTYKTSNIRLYDIFEDFTDDDFDNYPDCEDIFRSYEGIKFYIPEGNFGINLSEYNEEVKIVQSDFYESTMNNFYNNDTIKKILSVIEEKYGKDSYEVKFVATNYWC